MIRTPLVLAIIAATSATCSADCRHLYHRQAIVQHHAYVQPVVLYSVGDATLVESAVEKALQRREALQATRPQQTAPQSVLSAKCARCHSGENAKAGVDFTTAIDATTFRRSVELLGTGRDTPSAMKGVLSALTPAEKGSLTEELLTLSARPIRQIPVPAKLEPPVTVPEPEESGVLR